MLKRVDFKKAHSRKTIQIAREPTKKIETIIHGSASSEMLPAKTNERKDKYKPLVPALPKTIGSPPTIADRIRAAKKLNMTRRDITEQRIIRNILLHNNPKDVHNFEVLYIANKQNSALENQLNREISRNTFVLPRLQHETK
jgi:hypothetical protein